VKKSEINAAEQNIAMIRDLELNQGWLWLKQNMELSLRTWQGVIDETLPTTPEGAGKIARAQGAKIAISQMLNMPAMTSKALRQGIEVARQEAAIAEAHGVQDEDEEST
jgi:hypothetical protein